ncbi:putative WRKY transcription factor 19 [Phytophthora citrophthora]|uniref:WRKY transcription factor 19 n=1 Tax=Phytophthora citrophthora TaxID=4793 RepID=A0AAD9GGN4_9STRA|nr:putative WRKY transcription factor 19 [Phytophthora citrophthora]
MDAHPWIMTQARADLDNLAVMQQTDEMKRQLMSSCSPTINLANTTSTIATTPLLPSFGSISPANTTTTTRFPIVGGSSLLNPLKLEYCRFQGCANFGKMQGYCHDHIHGRPAPQFPSPSQSPFVQTSNPLPSLVLPSPVSQQYLPALRTVVPTRSRSTGDRQSVYPNYDSVQPGSPLYTTATYNNQSPIYTEHTNFLSVPLNRKPRVIASPTPSTGSTGSSKPVAKCRRAGCVNDARRKGLCMEHGGRHFCKMAGCQKCAHRGGFCISHGGGRRCAVANCTKSAQSGGICYSHGGGKRCATEGCTHAARSGGFCIKHGKQQQALQQQRQC